MIQEYLFITDEYKDEIKNSAIDETVKKEIITIQNSSCWMLYLYADGENEQVARKLDLINSQICEKFRPTVLSNGCSAYFNKSLFPIVNEFERKLRKLLYLASALQEDNETNEVIKNIESKDLGKIFEGLFTDADFVKKVKEKVNQKTWQYTRKEILRNINELDENTLWDKLLGVECVETLREKFNEIKDYRNDVMHAHNINLKQYRAAKRLFQKVNDELDMAINELMGTEKKNQSVTINNNFNNAIRNAFESIQQQINIPTEEDLKKTIQMYIASCSELAKHVSKLQEIEKEGIKSDT